MYILTNALQNLKRNLGRNLLLGLMMLAVLATTVVALVIANTAEAVISDYEARFASEAHITPDFERIQSGDYALEEVWTTPESFVEFANSAYLASAILNVAVSTWSPSHTAIGEADMPDLPLFIQNPDGSREEPEFEMTMPTLRVIGSTDVSEFEEFGTGERQLLAGRWFEAVGEVLVSMDFAHYNGLEVGDILELQSPMAEMEPLAVTVVGIYADGTVVEQHPMFQMVSTPVMNRRNEVLTHFETIAQAPQFQRIGNVSGRYFLESPDDLAAFEADIRSMGLSDLFVVSTDVEGFEALVAPVQGLRTIAVAFMWVVLGLGALILVLLSSLAIRERKYEIGVLRAMGLKKSKVALGLLCEMLALTSFALVLGLLVGSASAQPLSDVLLSRQVEALETEEMGFQIQGGMLMLNQTPETPPLSELDLQLEIGTLLELTGISMLLAGVASVASIGAITKYEPMKILAERN